jgi:hypothetical protein
VALLFPLDFHLDNDIVATQQGLDRNDDGFLTIPEVMRWTSQVKPSELTPLPGQRGQPGSLPFGAVSAGDKLDKFGNLKQANPKGGKNAFK